MGDRALLDLLLEYILIVGKDGKLEYCNKPAIDKLNIKGDISLISPRDIFPVLYERALERREDLLNKNIETEMYKANKTCFPVIARVTKQDDEKYYICAVDNSIRKNMEKELTKTRENLSLASTTQTDFISNITHELRTPVNGMLGLTRTLYDTDLSPMQLDTVQVIERSCVNMSKIINDFLDFSKLESGKIELENNEFNFRNFLDKTLAANITLINDKGLKLVVYVADDVPMNLIGDELRLTQVLNNLISNAVKFTSVGYITVEVTQTLEQDDYVELFFVVMDTGIGIAKSDMDKLFKRFSQVDASITRRFGGTGLGLSICAELVRMMGGSIKVESEEGKGSAFSFNVRLRRVADSINDEGVKFPSGRFVYEGTGHFTAEGNEKKKSLEPELYGNDERYRFGTSANMDEIRKNMDKLIICIDMDNWEKAESFAGIIKNLAADNRDLKREVFRMELLVRKADKEGTLMQYEIVKEKLAEVEIDGDQ